MSTPTEYAKALFSLAKEEGLCDKIFEELEIIKQSVVDCPEYIRLLDTPALPLDERLALIDGSLGTLTEYTVTTVKLLAKRRMTYLLSKVIEEYVRIYDIDAGNERVVAISAVALTEQQKERLIRTLEEQTHKHIILTNEIDPEILGGMKLRYLGRQLDGSLKGRLDRLAKSIKQTVV